MATKQQSQDEKGSAKKPDSSPAPASAPVLEASPLTGSAQAVQRVAEGGMLRPTEMLSLQGSVGNLAAQRLIQRKEEDPGITEPERQSAKGWATTSKISSAAIKELQGALSVEVTGSYDDATIDAVFAKQRQGQPKGKIANAGRASKDFFARLGLIFTEQVTAATIDDKQLEEIKTLYPDGVTVAIYAKYADASNNNLEFDRQAEAYAKSQKTLGLKDGKLTIGAGAVPITELGDVLETVHAIHEGLVAKYKASQPQGTDAEGEGGEKKEEAALPAFTQIKNLSLFAHGEPYGVALNAENAFRSKGRGLFSDSTDPLYPANVEAFARGLSPAITSDIRVQLFSCSAARDLNADPKWDEHNDGRGGETSFAAALAEELGEDASVYSHTTAGHTTENYAARVFGKDAGEGEGGLHLFDLMYDETFIQSELTRLFPDKSAEELAALRTPLRDQMWAHFKDSITGEHKRTAKEKKYPKDTNPIGQEMFANPENAKATLRDNWTTAWIPPRLKNITVPNTPKKK